MKHLYVLALAGLTAATAMAENAIYVDTGQRGHDINESMYGIFFEEINHSGDGGLYAELLQNRGFEEQTLPGGFTQTGDNQISTAVVTNYNDLGTRQFVWNWDFAYKKMLGWRVDSYSCTLSYDVATPAVPLHEATPNAMCLNISNSTADGCVRLINTGYWGVAVEAGAKYDLRFYLNTANYASKVKAVVYDASCTKELASAEFDVDHSGTWREYTTTLTASESISDGNFALVFSGNGTVNVDYVSLFPQATFCGRSNGLRADLAQFLVDMHPKFMRWPGGCIVEGIVLDNRVKWKETLGDPMTRPGQYDLWGYRSTWGMGYHEILQFCEDAGMDCMFVGNAGMACGFHTGEHVQGDANVDPFYQDIRDAIEYAIGDPATNEWAARRAAAGHPAPFPLKYVEIGNENGTERYNNNFKYIYGKLKQEYPQITFLNTVGIAEAEALGVKTDMIDPHWYVAPEFFYNNRWIFDDVPRGDYTIYVGEYATNSNVGKGNMDAALSEAVFMMSMERNSDIVKMASYAPLITNDNAPNWPCNLIWQHSGALFGRASYYVQKMYAEHLPTYNVGNALLSDLASVPYEGRVGIGTWQTSATFRNLKVTTPDGEVLYSGDFANKRTDWLDMQGTWAATANGEIAQSDASLIRCITLMDKLAFRDCAIEVEACKTGGVEGFLIVVGCNDDDWNHYYQFNVGGWYNSKTAIEDVNNGGGGIVSNEAAFTIENNRWYKLKVVCHNGTISGYIDGQLYCTYATNSKPAGRVAAHAGYDEATGEVVVKVVNAESVAMTTDITLNAANINPTASVEVLKAYDLWDENSFEYPTLIYPEKRSIGNASGKFNYTFEPYSLTIMRVKADPATTTISIPQQMFSTTPRELDHDTTVGGATGRLKKMIEEAVAVALSDMPGYDTLSKATETAKTVLAGGDEAAIKSQASVLEAALNAYYKEAMNASEEMTSKLKNPHFEKAGDTSGWSGSPTVNEHVAEMYNTTFSIGQNVSDLENGYYLVYFQGYYRNGGQEQAHTRHEAGTENLLAEFTLNDMRKPIVSSMSEKHSGYWWDAPNTMSEAHAVFSQSADYYANYLIAPVTEGTLRIRLMKTQTEEGDWFCFDNVRLFKLPTKESGIEDVAEEFDGTFSPAAMIYDLQGRVMGGYPGLNRLTPGIYVVREGGHSAKLLVGGQRQR